MASMTSEQTSVVIGLMLIFSVLLRNTRWQAIKEMIHHVTSLRDKKGGI
jgi:hypothetical protein